MDDLTAFLRARYDERETALRRAGEGRIAWLTYLLDNGELSHTTVAADHHDGYWCTDGKLLPQPASVLIVYDRDEALACIAADRAIVERCERAINDHDAPYGDGTAALAESVLIDLGTEFSAHPDYRAGWAA